MTLSTFALLVAAIESAVGLPLLVAPSRSGPWMIRFVRDDNTYRLVGLLTLLLCLAAVVDGLALSFDARGAIALLACWGVIKGLLICWCPSFGEQLVAWWFASIIRTRVAGAMAVAISGLVLWGHFWLIANPRMME